MRVAPVPLSAPELYRQAYDFLEHGRLDDAQRCAQEGLRRSRSDEAGGWDFRVVLAEVGMWRRDYRAALALLEPAPPPDARTVTRVRALFTAGLLRCRIAGGETERAQADALLSAAERQARALHDPWLVADASIRHGGCATQWDRFDEARASLERALAVARQAGLPVQEMAAAGSIAFLHLRDGRYDAAAEWSQKSLDIAVRTGNELASVKNAINLGQSRLLLGEAAQALPAFDDALRRAGGASSYSNESLIALIGRADALQQLGQEERAREAWARARSLASKNGLAATRDVARIEHSLAELALRTGHYEQAQAQAQAALRLKLEAGDDAGAKHVRLTAARIDHARGRYEAAVRAYLEVLGSPKTEFRVRWQARARLAALYADMRRNAESEAEFRRAFAEMEEGREALSEPSSRIAFVSTLGEFYDSYVEFLVSRGRASEALEVADRSRARLLMERLGERGRRARVVTTAEFRRLARRTNSALLSYWLAPKQSYLWSVTGMGVELHVLPGQDEICRQVGAYQSLVQNSRDPLDERRPEGRALYDALIGPVAKRVPRGSRALLVLDGCLHQLNFETLLPPGDPPRYWIEDVTLGVAPSLGSLEPGAGATTAARERSLLVIGAPESPNGDFPPLAQAEREVASIAALFPPERVTARTGAAARPDAYADARPERFALIHFAAHASANRDSPLDSAVILSPRGDDYKLYARDIMRVPLRADLVTLSACHSAGARAYAGEGLVGLAWAFLSAGSRHVIAGLWNVEDASTADLMAKLYRGLRDGRDASDALRAAKLELLGSHTAYRKPFYWAPFMVYARAPATASAGQLSAGVLRHQER